MKLIQKHWLKGTQQFELLDDEVHIRIKGPFKNKDKTVPFVILNPEPQIDGAYLHFHSRVKCGPLISLYLNKPDKQTFNAFVDALKQKALHEYSAFAGINSMEP